LSASPAAVAVLVVAVLSLPQPLPLASHWPLTHRVAVALASLVRR
jgi:hypothetical protein